jgi:hypothetical protein
VPNWEQLQLATPSFRALAADPVAAAEQGLSAWLVEAGAGALHRPHALAQVARARQLAALTREVLAGLPQPTVLLKGAGVAHRYYPWPWVRPASDVDVWVSPATVAQARVWFRANGFVPIEPFGLKQAFAEHHFGFARGDSLVELHFQLFRGFGGARFDDAQVFARRQSSDFEGVPVSYLAAEDEVLYLAVHAANHAFLRLSWLLDLAYLIQRTPRLDWGVVRRRAADAKLQAPVALALAAMQAVLRVQLPQEARFGGWRARFGGRWLRPGGAVAKWRWGPALVGAAFSDSPAHAFRHLGAGAVRAARRWAADHGVELTVDSGSL